MKDYKNTLNLPTTEFPMKASLPQREPDILQRWEKLQLYQRLRQRGEAIRQQDASRLFILCDGPPYANGHLHIGHALNKSLKDIAVKAKSLSGYDAPFVPGWDCHGLPIELNVEKKMGKAGDEVSPQQFRQACRDYAASQIDIQRTEFKRLGVMGDWENPYETMHFKFEANIIRGLAKIIENGHLVQGYKPVHWCLECGSALAEAEVEYANKISPTLDVAFTVANNADFYQRLSSLPSSTVDSAWPVIIPIWTTTPWTLPANAGVSLHPEIKYCVLAIQLPTQSKVVLLVAADLMKACLQRYGIDINNSTVLATIQGEQLAGLSLQHPFYQKEVPVILGEHVTTDTGTGAVHTAPAHGQDDYVMGLKYNLDWKNPVGNNGVYVANTPLFAGEHIFKANAHITEILQASGKLLHQDKLEHSYPHCWRHKTPLIFLATPQWFISLHAGKQTLAADAIKSTTAVHWLPGWGQANMTEMLSNRPDWCISRQRQWGTPITVFIHKETRQLHPDTVNLMQKIAERIEREGMESWFSLSPEDILGESGKEYEKVTDVLDVWFDSGMVPFCVLDQRAELRAPADLVIEGSDQYRGWFQSLLVNAIAMQKQQAQPLINPQAPYKEVITHGFAVDEKGRKMSKSLGNVIAPEKVINSLGADILRLWVASTDYHNEIAVSDDILKRIAEAYRRIRNTMRYLLSNLFDFDPEKNSVPIDEMLSLDRWALERAQNLQAEIINAYDNYELHTIFHKLQNFCIVDMGGFYLDIIKDRQYTMAKNSTARRSAQTAMFQIAEAMARWIAPILSFTAEEVWSYLPGQHSVSVFLEEWYQIASSDKLTDPLIKTIADFDRGTFWQSIMQVREAVNKEIEKARDEGQVGSSLEAEVTIYCHNDSTLGKKLLALGNELRFLLITSTATVATVTQPHPEGVEVRIQGEKLWINVNATMHTKCVRCWHRRDDVGIDKEHPDICLRCVENVLGTGEIRCYA